jgi:hypothetical protein
MGVGESYEWPGVLAAMQRFCTLLVPCLYHWVTIRLRDGNEWAVFVPRRSLHCMIAHILSKALVAINQFRLQAEHLHFPCLCMEPSVVNFDRHIPFPTAHMYT